jgi:hypothetical protein
MSGFTLLAKYWIPFKDYADTLCISKIKGPMSLTRLFDMKRKQHFTHVLFALLFWGFAGSAQGIEINQELRAQAPEWKVKIGTAWPGKITNFRFGEYAVVQSKQGASKSSYNQKPFTRNASSSAELEFSFTLCNSTKDSVFVSAASRTNLEERKAALEFEWLSVGESGILSESDYFEVRFGLENGEKTDWLMLLVRSWREGQEKVITEMSDGERTIQIVPVRSSSDDARKIPALGFEFELNGEAIAAVQYYGGGMLGLNKNKVWLRPDLDPELKLVLSGAMTALMDYKLQRGPYQ